MKKTRKLSLLAGILAAGLSLAAWGAAQAEEILPKAFANGETVQVYYRKGLPPEAARARAGQFKTETMILKKGTVRREGTLALPCDILFEKDVPVTLRDGTVIYTDVFRPVDDEKHPAIMAWSPYGKEIGGQWLDDVPGRSGVPRDAVSDLQKFEGPDPAYWVAHGYAIINPDSRGAYESKGNLNYWGSEMAKDGADTIEWIAAQPWSNGKVGMSGNSYLTVSQWFIAAEKPAHLAAIAPWEGFSDHFRETANRGGIPNPVFPEAIFESLAGRQLLEDQPRMVVEYPFMNAYWEDKKAKLGNISIPAYVVASYTNDVHTHGTFEGYQQIASQAKWLRVHDTNEWFDYYDPAHVEDLRKFFDHYLKGEDNGWETTPPIRLSVLDPGHQHIVDRLEKSWPLEGTIYKKLYLSDVGTLGSPQPEARVISYDAEDPKGTSFQVKFDQDTELTGYMKLHMYVEADGSNDMDLAVTVQKLDEKGNPIPDPMTHRPICAYGYLRVSQRALDETASKPYDPVLKNESEDRLSAGEIVPVDIAIWPMGMKYHKGESLLLTIAPYMAPDASIVPPFGSAKITVPKDGFTYEPGTQPEMITLGGNETETGAPEDKVTPPASRNHGTHKIHLGGIYDSYLQVPFVKR